MNRRIDPGTASLIDAAIHAAAARGPVGAAQALVASGLPWELVMRVLDRPCERRTYLRGSGAAAE